MVPFNKKNILTAYFEDANRQVACVVYNDEEGNPTNFYVSIDDEVKWNELLLIADLEDMHTNTFNRWKAESKQFKEFAIQAAKDEGFITESESGAQDRFLTNLFSDDPNTDDLFQLKLALFEQEKVKGLSREYKGKLRKAKTYLEAIAAITDGLYNDGANQVEA